jgi:hypothetical protein
MLHKVSRAVRNFMRWLFGSPFQDLPEGFGEPMPEIRAFEEEMDVAQHRATGKISTAPSHGHERFQSEARK